MRITLKEKGLDKAMSRLKDFEMAMRKGLVFAVGKAGEKVLEDAQANFVPYVTGRLHDSGKVVTKGTFTKAEAIISFDTDYALWVHENTHGVAAEGSTEGGRGAKYLERPLRNFRAEFLDVVAVEVGTFIGWR